MKTLLIWLLVMLSASIIYTLNYLVFPEDCLYNLPSIPTGLLGLSIGYTGSIMHMHFNYSEKKRRSSKGVFFAVGFSILMMFFWQDGDALSIKDQMSVKLNAGFCLITGSILGYLLTFPVQWINLGPWTPKKDIVI